MVQGLTESFRRLRSLLWDRGRFFVQRLQTQNPNPPRTPLHRLLQRVEHTGSLDPKPCRQPADNIHTGASLPALLQRADIALAHAASGRQPLLRHRSQAHPVSESARRSVGNRKERALFTPSVSFADSSLRREPSKRFSCFSNLFLCYVAFQQVILCLFRSCFAASLPPQQIQKTERLPFREDALSAFYLPFCAPRCTCAGFLMCGPSAASGPFLRPHAPPRRARWSSRCESPSPP